MKRALIIAAAGVVIATNIWMLLSVSRNREGAAGGAVELTERELRLSPIQGESTVLFLDLEWDAVSAPWGRRYEPQWLDSTKLSELGFDCDVSVSAPEAEKHYRSMTTRLVFLVLEYEGKAWKQAPMDRRLETRLFAVDAGRDPESLREKYPDPNQYIVTRGLVRLRFQKDDSPGGKLLPVPRLQGRIGSLLPSRIFVPRPYQAKLRDLVESDEATHEGSTEEPRFAATISWGNHYEPWVTGARLLSRSE